MWRSGGNWASRDVQEYRAGYPGKKDDLSRTDNLLFYQNKLRCRPDNKLVEEIHKDWWGNLRVLEAKHGYIQWLFPIRERGVNAAAQELQPHEAKAIMADPAAMQRVQRSYEMLLDFYGMRLSDPATGAIARSDRWKECYRNLNGNSHNYLRITRILKFLGEVGLERLKKPFVLFVLQEILVHHELQHCRSSCESYWAGVLRSEDERREVERFVAEHDSGDGGKGKSKPLSRLC
eukprot:TRINITY_DN4489_c0_g2_i1.p1 TRINITY_DN4489_c0_g2~~TRINITY_DN4489_c0_g2_i1.p1  ORF type:complete len:234 (+),score=69.12 TRINITY_DN4489_c0_g2_i1:76-777(+)